MKIAPVSSASTAAPAGIDGQAARIQGVRSLKMSTNATPGHEAAPPAEELSTQYPIDPATATPEATEPLSPQFAALAKQRRMLQQERQAFEQEKAAREQAPAQDDAQMLAQLKSDPLRTMLDAGVTYEQLTEAILAEQNGITPEMRALKAEIKALKEGVDQRFSEKATQEEQQVLSEMKRDATSLVATGDDFELVRETHSIPDVMDLILKTYKDTGEVLDVREALTLYETELVKDSLKVARFKKVQSQLAPAEPAQGQPQQRQMRTLTNRDTANVPLSPKQRALAAFYGTLKK